MVLILGGMGFIGLHCARRFLDGGDDVVLSQHRAHREPAFLQGHPVERVRVERLDVTDGAAVLDVLRRNRVDSIVHLAVPALRDVDPLDEFTTNVLGLRSVLEAGRQAGVRRITVASSLAVYSGVPHGPWHEEVPLPVTSSNHTEAYKKAIEILGLHLGERTGVEVVMVRLAGIFGPLYHSMANLPSRLCVAASRGVEPDLTDLRAGVPRADVAHDWCYVEDCAAGIHAVHAAPSLRHHVYNVGGGRATTVGELVAAVRRSAPEAPAAQIAPPDTATPPRTDRYMDLSRITGELGYRPEFGVDGGVARYLDWLREHEE
ncbi:MAG: NAD(P)-dependent oxidoreductase [bacterium]|jgi:nucleoside-diphosphate-sugar epimerase|nr:NAD(P)-dependent oxidoreductase [bacterium]